MGVTGLAQLMGDGTSAARLQIKLDAASCESYHHLVISAHVRVVRIRFRDLQNTIWPTSEPLKLRGTSLPEKAI